MANQQPSPNDDLRPTPGEFSEPETLGHFNERLRQYRVAMPVSPAQYAHLRDAIGKPRLLNALRSLHAGGRNRGSAVAFLKRAVEEARASAPADAAPAGPSDGRAGAAIKEPANIGELNQLLARIDPSLRVTPEVNGEIIAKIGRQQLLDFLVLAFSTSADQPYGVQALRAAIADARVRVARKGQASTSSSADEIPTDDAGDGGFTGLPPHEPERRLGHPAQPEPRRPDRSQGHRREPAAGRHQDAGHARDTGAGREGAGQQRSQSDFTPKPQARAYGKAAAVCVEQTTNANKELRVCVEVAAAIPNRDKTYDWKNKQIFHLMRKELLQLIAVLFRMAPGAHFKNHGPTKVKWLKVENQQGKVYLSMGDKDVKTVGIPISEADVLADMAAIVLDGACKSFHGIEPQALLGFVRAAVAPDMRPGAG